jgi:putative RecB family exonuclease
MQTFSYSKITTFRNCPKAYEFRYVLGETERFSTIERHMGTAVHEALRWAYAERQDGRRPGPEQVVERYDGLWWSPALSRSIVVKTGLSDEDYRLDGRQMVDSHARGMFQTDDSETLGLEARFQMKLTDGVTLTGVIDRIARARNGMLRIIDYKTGSRVPNPLSDPQLVYYAAWAFDHYPDDPTAELTYVDMRNGRELTAEFHRGAIVPHIEKLVQEIERIAVTDEFPASPSLLCKWCGYNPICPAVDSHTRAAGERAAGAATAGATTVAAASANSGTAPVRCPECGSALVARNGKFGNFIGCSGYPRCRYTRDDW